MEVFRISTFLPFLLFLSIVYLLVKLPLHTSSYRARLYSVTANHPAHARHSRALTPRDLQRSLINSSSESRLDDIQAMRLKYILTVLKIASAVLASDQDGRYELQQGERERDLAHGRYRQPSDHA